MSGSSQNCYSDEINNDINENNPTGNYKINNNEITISKSFEPKTKMVE